MNDLVKQLQAGPIKAFKEALFAGGVPDQEESYRQVATRFPEPFALPLV